MSNTKRIIRKRAIKLEIFLLHKDLTIYIYQVPQVGYGIDLDVQFCVLITIACCLCYFVCRQFCRTWWIISSYHKAFLAKKKLADFLHMSFKKIAIFFDSWIAVAVCLRIFSKIEKSFFVFLIMLSKLIQMG